MLHSDIPVWIPFVAAAALAAMWLQSASRLARRRQALASLAQRWQLMPNGDNLPLGLTLRNTQLSRWMKVRNSYTGVIGSREIAFFDLSISFGDARWSRTVLARRGDDPLDPEPFGRPPLIQQIAGDWSIVFAPRRLFQLNQPFMPIQRIDAILQQLAAAPS